MQYGAPFQIEKKALDGTAWTCEGYCSTFGNTDLGGDIVQPGAFAEHLASGRKTRFLYAHDPAQVLGTAAGLTEDESGLYGRFKISKTPLGEQVRTLLKDGALDSFSIGYVARDYDHDRKAGTRLLKDVELVEVSVVSMPMNPAALVTGVKADFKAMGMEDIRVVLSRQRDQALEQARAYFQRRAAEGREPKDRVLEALEEWQRDAADEAERLLALLTDQKAPDPAQTQAEEQKGAEQTEPVAAGAAGLVASYLRRRAITERLAKYG